MNENKQNNLSRFWNEPGPFFGALALLCAVGLGALCLAISMNWDTYREMKPWVKFATGWLGVGFVIGIVFGLMCLLLSPIFPKTFLQPLSLRRRLFLPAAFVTLVALFYAVVDWRGRSAWEGFKRQWEAKGERFDRASIVPPAVPEAENFAMAPIVMSSYSHIVDLNGRKKSPEDTNVINRMKMPVEMETRHVRRPEADWGDWRRAVPLNLAAWQTLYRQSEKTTNLLAGSQSQPPAADVLLALGRYDAAIEELRLAARRPLSRFPIEYDAEDTATILLPHLAALKGCVQTLQLRASSELAMGRADKALDDIRLMLRLADSVKTEPVLISHLVRLTIVHLAIQPVWEGLVTHKWNDEHLALLGQDLQKIDFLASYQHAMRSEMILFYVGIIDYLRKHPDNYYTLGEVEYGSPALENTLLCMAPDGWFYQSQRANCRIMLEYFIPVCNLERRTMSPNSVSKAEAALSEDLRHWSLSSMLQGMLLPALGRASMRFAAGQTALDQTRIACALERHRLAHGAYPESLDALAPAFLQSVPHDVINGQPMKYNRTEEGGFVLYSVGWNQTDDGGRTGLIDTKSPDSKPGVKVENGDWVWQFPKAQSR